LRERSSVAFISGKILGHLMLNKIMRRSVRFLLPRLADGPELGQQIALDMLKFRPETVIKGYLNGFFPMADDDGDVHWMAPKDRGVIPVDDFHVPKNLKRLVRQQKFEIRVDTCFDEVIRGCAERDETWITDDFIKVYNELHERGVARSVEAFQEGELVGGLYGIAIGKYFATESQFHRVRDAGKIAFIYLAEMLKSGGYQVHDVQYKTNFLDQFGCIEVPHAEFRQQVLQSVIQPAKFEASETMLVPVG
jgi:leucyl/phenylalanyl-tRNA---protein transferase